MGLHTIYTIRSAKQKQYVTPAENRNIPYVLHGLQDAHFAIGLICTEEVGI